MARIAFVLADEYEDGEFQEPYDALRADGHTCLVVGTQAGKEVAGKRGRSRVRIEKAAREVAARDLDALVIPGGHSPDRLRTDADVVKLVRAFFEEAKPVAAICHAGHLLIEAGVVRGRRLTSWPSVRTDLQNAGATWVDREVVEDGNLITSRNPDDVPAFLDAIRAALAEVRVSS